MVVSMQNDGRFESSVNIDFENCEKVGIKLNCDHRKAFRTTHTQKIRKITDSVAAFVTCRLFVGVFSSLRTLQSIHCDSHSSGAINREAFLQLFYEIEYLFVKIVCIDKAVLIGTHLGCMLCGGATNVKRIGQTNRNHAKNCCKHVFPSSFPIAALSSPCASPKTHSNEEAHVNVPFFDG